MAAGAAEWERITPPQLVPAIKHIRKLFNRGAWKSSELTRRLCYASLHPQEADPTYLAPYATAFVRYRQIVSVDAQQPFNDLLKVGTPPSVFRAYLDVYRMGLEVDVRDEFGQILQIGIANANVLKMHPVEWAKSHLQLLVDGNAYRVKIWTKEVCDKRDLSREDAEKEFDERIHWRSWRAPRLIHMEPSGGTPYSAANAWTREDEPRTQTLLESLANQFTEFLGIYLDKVVGDAYVRLAKEPVESSSESVAPTIGDGSRGSAKRKRSKLEIRRDGIFFGALQAHLRGLKYCKHLDDNKIQPLEQWRSEGCPNTYAAAYKKKTWRKKIHDQKHRFQLQYDSFSRSQCEKLIEDATRPTR